MHGTFLLMVFQFITVLGILDSPSYPLITIIIISILHGSYCGYKLLLYNLSSTQVVKLKDGSTFPSA